MNLRTMKNRLKSVLPKRLNSQIVFYKNHHRFINAKAPELLDEKLLLLMEQYADDPHIKSLVDKYAVRSYLEKAGYASLLNELYQVCDSPEEINWGRLPDKYVVKCNHGSGYNIIVQDASRLDRDDAMRKLKKWMSEDYGRVSGERQYCGIPRKILVEKYLESKDGHFPPDYKFFVSYGKVLGCLLVVERDTARKLIYVDTDFNDLGFMHEYTKPDYKKFKPASWEQQVKVAAQLGKDFPLVRVDLYDQDGKILFGELTFTSNGGICNYFSMEGQKYIGRRIAFPDKNR